MIETSEQFFARGRELVQKFSLTSEERVEKFLQQFDVGWEEVDDTMIRLSFTSVSENLEEDVYEAAMYVTVISFVAVGCNLGEGGLHEKDNKFVGVVEIMVSPDQLSAFFVEEESEVN